MAVSIWSAGFTMCPHSNIAQLPDTIIHWHCHHQHHLRLHDHSCPKTWSGIYFTYNCMQLLHNL